MKKRKVLDGNVVEEESPRTYTPIEARKARQAVVDRLANARNARAVLDAEIDEIKDDLAEWDAVIAVLRP